MAFKKWDDRRVPQKRSLRLNHANLNIGWTAYEEIGGPERVDVFYDKEAKAIQILPNKEGRKVSKCRNCSDARLCDKHHEELYTDSKPEKPHEHQWHDYPNGTFCLDCGRVKLPEDEPSKPEKPNLEPYLDAIYLVGESSNDVNNLALIQAIKDLAEKVEALLATEYDRGKVDAFKSIYAQATTTEWPRTYEAWHDQLKRVIEAELKGENHESGE